MAEERAQRRLAAILAADVAGYSRLMGADEEGTLARLKAHRRDLVEPKINEHRGRIVKTTGDGMLVEFASVVDALRCAIEIQRGMVERNTEVRRQSGSSFASASMSVTLSLTADIYGDGVNVAARLEGLADPGGICVSSRVQEDTRGKLDIPFEDGASSGSRTSPGRCASTGCSSAVMPQRRGQPCRFPTGRPSPSCPSRI